MNIVLEHGLLTRSNVAVGYVSNVSNMSNMSNIYRTGHCRR